MTSQAFANMIGKETGEGLFPRFYISPVSLNMNL